MSRQRVCALAVLIITVACAPESGPNATATEPSSVSAESAEAGDSAAPLIVGRIGDRDITAEELDEFVREELWTRETANGDPAKLYDLRAGAIERFIDKTVVVDAATAKGMTADDFLNGSVLASSEIPEEEVEAYYEQNKDKIGDATLEQVAPRIRAYLRTQRAVEFVAKLRSQSNAQVLIEPSRVEVAATGPSKGPADAPITIVEFSDFQCPYCKRVVPTLDQIMQKYPDQVRVVFRHLPLDRIHQRARPAAEAAVCADKQGKFWAYHDLMFENNRALADEDLEKYASEVALDLDGFRQCVADREFQAIVESDSQAAEALGLRGTPAFFVNGIPLRGAKPFEDFVSVIDKELGRGAAAAPSS